MNKVSHVNCFSSLPLVIKTCSYVLQTRHSKMNKPVSLSVPSLSIQGERRGVHRHSPELQGLHTLDPVGEGWRKYQ